MKADLHIHTTISDGTDTPLELIDKVKANKIDIFSITDHDDNEGCKIVLNSLTEDILFIPGIEFSCRRHARKFHILGYGYDISAPSITNLINVAHDIRMAKANDLISYLKDNYSFTFSKEDIEAFLALKNPGKPHLARMMVNYNYVNSIQDAFTYYLNAYRSPIKDPTPRQAIQAIKQANGLAVLAHGIYGDGNQYLSDEELEYRVSSLKEMGLDGLECYYSKYQEKELKLTKSLCLKYNLLATVGSDYHGKNKKVLLGENHLDDIYDDEEVVKFINIFKDRKII